MKSKQSDQLTLEIAADGIAILFGREIISVTVAPGIAKQMTATGLFVEVSSQYIGIAMSFLHGLATDLCNQW